MAYLFLVNWTLKATHVQILTSYCLSNINLALYKMKHLSILVFTLLISIYVFSQSATYKYSISLKNSEIADYQLEQSAYLQELFNTKHCNFNKKNDSYIITSTVLYSVEFLNSEFQKKKLVLKKNIKISSLITNNSNSSK